MARGDVRAAGERLEKGIERYGDGDLVGAAVEFEEALRLSPDHARARQYLSWVRDVLAGTRGNGKKKDLDEDAVRAVTEALDAGEDEAPRRPVAVAPISQPPLSSNTIPYGLDEAIAARTTAPGTAPTELAVPIPSESLILPDDIGRTLTSFPQVERPKSNPQVERPKSNPQVERPKSNPQVERPKTPSSQTILGMAPPKEGILRPVPQAEESVTREFRRSPETNPNMPPLDVPELTEDQVAELISLEATLPTTGPGGRPLTLDLASTPDLPTEQRIAFVEFEAEATPVPHRAPTRDRRLEEEPHLKLQPLPFHSDFDPLELDPTRARETARPTSVLNPLPVDEPAEVHDPADEEATQNPTNPFISQKLADYAYPEDEPTGSRINPKPSIAEIMGQAKRVLANGDAQTAIDIADDVVTAAGGVDADPCLPFLSLLEKIYESMIGSFDQVPRHGEMVPDLDPRAAFLLSRLDNSMSVDDLLEVSGMPRLEAMRVLALLIRHGAVVTS